MGANTASSHMRVIPLPPALSCPVLMPCPVCPCPLPLPSTLSLSSPCPGPVCLAAWLPCCLGRLAGYVCPCLCRLCVQPALLVRSETYPLSGSWMSVVAGPLISRPLYTIYAACAWDAAGIRMDMAREGRGRGLYGMSVGRRCECEGMCIVRTYRRSAMQMQMRCEHGSEGYVHFFPLLSHPLLSLLSSIPSTYTPPLGNTTVRYGYLKPKYTVRTVVYVLYCTALYRNKRVTVQRQAKARPVIDLPVGSCSGETRRRHGTGQVIGD